MPIPVRGVAVIFNNEKTMPDTPAAVSAPEPLCTSVARCMEHYFAALGGHTPRDLYNVVLTQVEPPLLRAALRYCRGNQSRTAEVLGINRATLRKKLTIYAIDPAMPD